MTERVSFLLINGSRDDYWHKGLEEALAPFGALQIGTQEDALCLDQLGTYDLFIIDATVIGDVLALIGRIRAQRPDARIVVVTASPTWRRAREAFQAGAIDYIRKSLDQDELQSALRGALDKTLPPWR